MLGWLTLGCTIVVAGKLAEIESRNAYLWGIATGVAVLALVFGFGVYLVFANVLALVGEFICLWIAKSRDAKRAGRPF
jgi:hypothetical protein